MTIAVLCQPATLAPESGIARIALLVTQARLPVAGALAAATWTRDESLGLVLLFVFVILDVVDGVIARSGGRVESSRRRAWDSLIDRTAVLVCLGVASTWASPLALVAVGSLIANAFVFPAALQSWRRGIVIKSPSWHRVWSVSAFCSGGAVLLGHVTVSVALGVVFVLAQMVASVQLRGAHLALVDVTR